MKKRSFGIMFALAGGIAVSQAQAEEVSSKTNVVSASKEATQSVQYRVDMDFNDHGFKKTDSYKPKMTESTSLKNLKLALKGKAGDSIDYYFSYDFAKAAASKVGLEYAKATWHTTDMFGFTFGKDRVNQAGWEPKESSIYTLANSRYVEAEGKVGMPFAKEVAMWEAHLWMGDLANVTVQAFDDLVSDSYDPTKAKTRGKWTMDSHQPAWNVEYTGKFGPVSPLLQMTSYDINHSKAFTLGVKAEVADFRALIDYTDDRAQTMVGDLKKSASTTNLSVGVDYTVQNLVKPFAKFAMFNVKDAYEDIKGNTADTGTNAKFETDALNDNATLINVGVWCLATGPHVKPYLAYTSKSGKFLKAATGDETESKTESHINLGISGEF